MNLRKQADPPKSNRNRSPWLLIAAFVAVIALIVLLRGSPTKTTPITETAPRVQVTNEPVTLEPTPTVESNAFNDFNRALGLLVPPPHDTEFAALQVRVWSGVWQEDERLTRFVTANAAALAALDQGLVKTNCILPAYKNPESQLTYLDSMWALSRLKSLRVKKALAESHAADAVADAVGIVRFGDMIMHGGGPLAAYRTGVAIKHAGYDDILQLVAGADVPEAGLHDLAEQLEPYQFDGNALVNSLEVEHHAVGLWLLEAASQPDFAVTATAVAGTRPSATVQTLMSGPPTYRPEETRNLMEEFFDMARFDATHPWPERKDIERALETALAAPFDLRTERNTFGLITLHLVFDEVLPTLIHQQRIEAEGVAVQTMCSLAIYYREHGSLPPTLADATPRLPIDPFSGVPLRYSQGRALLWSVGHDGTGDGAVSALTNGVPRGDLILQISFAGAAASDKPAN